MNWRYNIKKDYSKTHKLLMFLTLALVIIFIILIFVIPRLIGIVNINVLISTSLILIGTFVKCFISALCIIMWIFLVTHIKSPKNNNNRNKSN